MKPKPSPQQLTRWHFVVSLFFESIKYAHQAALYAVMGAAAYGTIGIAFSLAYLSANIAGMEGGIALVPKTLLIATAPSRWRYLIRRFLLPQLMLHGASACIVATVCIALTSNYAIALATGLLALIEGLRINTRPLVYCLEQSTFSARVESSITFCYIGLIWILQLHNKALCTPTAILYLYVLTTSCGLIYLVSTGTRYVKSITPKATDEELPTGIYQLRTQSTLMLLHLPQHLFSANFIVPFFARLAGAQTAGYLKISGELANGLRSIIKSTVGFPLNAMLTEKRTHTAAEKWRVFDLIHRQAIIAISCLAGIGCLCLAALALPIPALITTTLIGFCLLTVGDYLCLPYELVSIHVHAVGPAAQIRAAEVGAGICTIVFAAQTPLVTISILGLNRLLCWQLLKRCVRPPLLFKDADASGGQKTP